jgi:hypothetical protein
MQTKSRLLLCLIAIICFMGLAASRVTATEQPLSPAATQPPPRECTINAPLGVSVRIVAGPDVSGNPTGNFPLTDTCPGDFGTGGLCKKWGYKWTISGSGSPTFLNGAVSVDSDIPVLAAPGGTITNILNAISVGEGERFVKFSGSGTSFSKTLWTTLDAEPGTLTAAFLGKKGILPLAGRCPLAGADRPSAVSPDAATLVAAVEQAGICNVQVFRDPAGKIVRIELEGDSAVSCNIAAQGDPITDLQINGKPVKFIAEGKSTSGTGTCYSWYSAGRWYAVSSVVPSDCR